MNKLQNHDYVCPWWLLPAFDNPLRSLLQRPERILQNLVHPGQSAADIGCGMGYLTLPLARMVGQYGQVFAVDVQEQMLAGLRRRAQRAGLEERIHCQLANRASTGLSAPVDFIAAFWMVHEVPDQAAFFHELHGLLKPEGVILIIEPRVHVSTEKFTLTLQTAQAAGLKNLPFRTVFFSQTALLAHL